MKPASVVEIKRMRMISVELLPDREGGMFVIEGRNGYKVAAEQVRLCGKLTERSVYVSGLAGNVKSAQELGYEAMIACVYPQEEPGVYELAEGATIEISTDDGTGSQLFPGPIQFAELHPPIAG